MVSTPAEEGAILAAANIYHIKLRLARISAALDSLRAFRLSTPLLSQDQTIDFKERYLYNLLCKQQQAEHDTRHYVIATSRREACSPGGIPQWQTYMERLVFYRQLGISVSRVRICLSK